MILYAQRDKRRVGYVRLHQTAIGDWEMVYMKVEPEYRGRGVATDLLNRAKRIAEKDGVDLVGFIDPDGTGLTAQQETAWLKRHGFKSARYDLNKNRPRTLSQYIRRRPALKSVMIWTPDTDVAPAPAKRKN